MKRFSDEHDEEIIRCYEAGVPKRKIARDLKLSFGHIRRLVKERGYPPRAYHPPLSEETKEQIRNAYKNGMPRAEIAKRFKVGETSVDRLREGLPLQRRKATPQEAKVICMKILRGDKRVVIAAEHNRSESFIRQTAIRAGIPARPSRPKPKR